MVLVEDISSNTSSPTNENNDTSTASASAAAAAGSSSRTSAEAPPRRNVYSSPSLINVLMERKTDAVLLLSRL
ncbi:unnamed protein product, partial [Rotaria magnacalcarata]